MNKRYKVLVGSHSHGGRIFKKDEEIVTGMNLVAMFGENKFEDLGPSNREDVFSDTPATPTEPKDSDLPGRVASPRKASPKGG